MDELDELVDEDVISKLKSYIHRYGIDKHGDYSSYHMQTIKVETSGCIIKFCTWLSEDSARLFVVRLDKNTNMMFTDSFTENYLSEEHMLYYNEKMSHDATVVCAKSDMPTSAKVEFISVAMALFGAKDAKLTKKAR